MNFLRYLRPNELPPYLQELPPLQQHREIVLQNALNFLSLFFLAGAGILRVLFPDYRDLATQSLFIGLGLGIFALIRRIPFNWRALAVLLVFAIMGTSDLLANGLNGNGMFYLFTFALLSTAFFGTVTGILLTALTAIGELTIGIMMTTGALQAPVEQIAGSNQLVAWIFHLIAFLMSAGVLLSAIHELTLGFARRLSEKENTINALEHDRTNLENALRALNAESKKRNAMAEASRNVLWSVYPETTLESMLPKAANVIKEQFGLYHVGIFLLDEKGEYAVLRAATGEVGRKMLENQHRLRVGQVGIVGHAAATGEPNISPNVDEDPQHYPNPLLPDTRSEAALPLRVEGRLIGVLDLQSTEIGASFVDKMETMKDVADQLSILIERVGLMEKLQASLKEMEENTRQTVRTGWTQFFRNKKRQRYAFNMRASGSSLSSNGHETGDASSGTTLAVPIKIRNETLGVVNLKFATNRVPPEVANLVEQAVNRMAISLDNVRLLEEIQMRAEREQIVSEIAAKVRATNEIEKILEITAREIGRSLGASDVVVHLDTRK
ncbi:MULTISPECIES: GAF domain-containing protein [Anaerolinea]|uniref:GAF domain-containing protein n=1 Tax=Anaerolinea TaxID=233189 RepID=UPI00261EBB7F|nr:GAF domain-containing protein [Anaerolinea thermophila]